VPDRGEVLAPRRSTSPSFAGAIVRLPMTRRAGSSAASARSDAHAALGPAPPSRGARRPRPEGGSVEEVGSLTRRPSRSGAGERAEQRSGRRPRWLAPGRDGAGEPAAAGEAATPAKRAEMRRQLVPGQARPYGRGGVVAALADRGQRVTVPATPIRTAPALSLRDGTPRDAPARRSARAAPRGSGSA